MITQDEVEKIARDLLKFKFNNPETRTKKANEILSSLEAMKQVNVDGLKPTINVVQRSIQLKDDVVNEDENITKRMLDTTNQEVIANQISIKNIMK